MWVVRRRIAKVRKREIMRDETVAPGLANEREKMVLSPAHRKYSSSNPVMDTSSAPQLVKMFSYNNLIQKHFYKARVINFN